MPQQPCPESAPAPARHLVVHLDAEQASQALLESLQLLQSLQESRQFSREDCRAICSKVQLRISFALLHTKAPEFERPQVRSLALFHQRLATSLLSAQRLLHQLHQDPRSSRPFPLASLKD